MKKQDYQSMLRAVEVALEICDNSPGFMDQKHQEICENLRRTRVRLMQLIKDPALDA